MKKFYTFIFIAALMMGVGCTSAVEEVDAIVSGSRLDFYVDFDGETRISLGEDMRYVWEGKEQLGVYVASAAPTVNCPATVSLEDGRAKCWTTTKSYVTGDKMYVYYPWNEHNDMQGTTSVSLLLPTAQKQSQAGHLSVENMPMVASPLTLDSAVSLPTIYMRPLAALLCVNVYTSGAYAGEKVLSVKYEDADTPMAGSFALDMTKVGDSIELGACDKFSATVSLATPYSVGGSAASAKSIYLVLAGGTYDGILTVTTDKAIYSYAYSRSTKRNTYYNVNVNLTTATVRRSVESDWGGGDGSVENPYLVSSAADLVKLASCCNTSATTSAYSNKSYRQICDIDMSGVAFTPIGKSDSFAFRGRYDGGGYTIANLNVSPASENDACALFGTTVEAEIRNLTIKDMTNQSASEREAAFVGTSLGSTITDCVLEGQLNLYNLYSGGFVGYMESGRLANCEVKGRVENNVNGITWNGQTNTGLTAGFVGCATNGAVIEDCVLSGDVAVMGRYAAGIVSKLEDSTVRRCLVRNTSEISNVSHYCGGIVAIMSGNDALISDCRFEGRVNSGYTITGGIVGSITAGKVYRCISTSTSSVADDSCNVGGIAGEILTQASADVALIDSCAAYGNVEGAWSVGGIVGQIAHTTDGAYAGVTNCATIGSRLSSKGAYKKNYNLVGGVVGWITWITKNIGTTVVANCAGRAGAIYGTPVSELVSTKELLSGLIACVDNNKSVTIYGCYTDATRANVFVGVEPIKESTGTKRHGALFGYSYSSLTMTSCYYNESLGIHGTVGSGQTCNKTDCVAFTPTQMTNGTMLARLNAAATAYVPKLGTPAAKQWVADAPGYPVPSGLPADAVPMSAEPKKVSVIGDSISTFRGYIPYAYSTYYPRADGKFLSVEDMYWYRLIYNHMTNARLERNIAYSGSLVTNVTVGDLDTSNTYFAKRFIQQDGVGDADIVLIHGGTNDWNKNKSELLPGVSVRTTSAPKDSDMEALYAVADKAKSRAQIEALNDTTFCEAYIKLILLIKERNPQVKIVCIIGDYVGVGVQQATHKMAAHYGAKVVDLLAVGGFNDLDTNQAYMPKLYNEDKQSPGQCHPNQKAMAFIAEKIYKELGAWLEE